MTELADRLVLAFATPFIAAAYACAFIAGGAALWFAVSAIVALVEDFFRDRDNRR